MKKIIIGGIAIAAITVVSAFNVGVNTQNKNNLSLVSLVNVEALAQETGSEKETPCRKQTATSPGSRTTPCNTCVPTNDLYGSDVGECTKPTKS